MWAILVVFSLLPSSIFISGLHYDDMSFLQEYFIQKEGDILVFNKTKIPGMKSSALGNGDAKWPGGEVPVHFSPSFSNNEKKTIINAMMEIQQKTCVKFRLVNEEDSNFVMIIKPQEPGCASMVGRQGGPQVLYLSTGCFTQKIILHELMHSLGFIHEHNRSDRDKYVTVRWSNIKEGEEHNFEKRRQSSLSLMNTKYAYDSIMHYQGTEFSYNNRYPTLTPNKNNVRNMGGDNKLSLIDVVRINKYYGCPELGEEIEINNKKEESEEEEDGSEVEVEKGETTTTTAERPRQSLSTTMFPPINWRRNNCPNPYEIPEAGGNCRWLIMKVAKDPDSPSGYLHCLPSLKTSNILCGEWKRKQCAPGTVFDSVFRSCKPVRRTDIMIDEDSEEELY